MSRFSSLHQLLGHVEQASQRTIAFGLGMTYQDYHLQKLEDLNFRHMELMIPVACPFFMVWASDYRE